MLNRIYLCTILLLACEISFSFGKSQADRSESSISVLPAASAQQYLSDNTVQEKGPAIRNSIKNIALPSGLPNEFIVTLEHKGVTKHLVLQRSSVRGRNFQLLIQTESGVYKEIDPGPERTYQGSILGEPDSVVAASLLPEGLHADVFTNWGHGWTIRPGGNNAGNAAALEHIISDETDAEKPDFSYDTLPYDDTVDGAPVGYFGQSAFIAASGKLAPASAASYASYGCTVRQAEAAIDVEYKYYNAWGKNVGTVTSKIEATMNAMNALYVRDCLIKYVLGRVIIRTDSASCPYYNIPSGSGAGTWLVAMRDEWNANQAGSTHDLATLCAYNFGGGVAWVGVICGSNRYSVSGANSDGTFHHVWRHEAGHNWGCADYHNGCPEGSTIMCGNSLSLSRFSGEEVATIIGHRNSRTCLVDIGPYPTSIPPYAALDRVTIVRGENTKRADVLANDHDANCDTIVIDYFDTVSALGAAISRSAGTGPDGRDELIYNIQPGKDYYGMVDSFTYTAGDGTGQQGKGTVMVTLPAQDFVVTPDDEFYTNGPVGGPFAPSYRDYTLRNNSWEQTTWTAAYTSDWLSVQSGGSISPESSVTVRVSLTAAANSLPIGTYTDTIIFTDVTHGTAVQRQVRLEVKPRVLQGYWKLDETAGTVAFDSSGFSLNGTLKSGAAFDTGSVAGRFGTALNMDGVDDYIEVPALNLYSNRVTLAAWVNWNGSQNDWAGIVFCRAGSTTAGLSMKSNGELRYHWNDSAGSYNWGSNLIVPTNKWVFVALVVEPERATIYMHDGTLRSAYRTAVHDIEEFNGVTGIGRDNSGRTFRGAIDDVRIYNFALDSTAMAALAAGARAEPKYPFNDEIDVLTIASLSWIESPASVAHDVYFGTNYTNVLNASDVSAEYKGRTTQTFYTPDVMLSDTAYYWRIDEVLANQTVIKGSVWKFTTGNASIASELKVHYTFDTKDLSGSTVYDVSPAPAYNGTISGATPASAGMINQAITFDGSNDYVSIPTLALNSNTVTMSAWIKRNGNQNAYSGIVICVSSKTKSGLSFYSDNKLGYHWAGNYWGWDSGLVVPDNQWCHIALVVEPTQATLYLNGQPVTNTATHDSDEFDNITRIASYDGWSGRFYKGLTDDVAIWKRALSKKEILAIYYRGLNGKSFDNTPPGFLNNPVVKPAAIEGRPYTASLASDASDPDNDPLTFSKINGPAWLNVSPNGQLSGIPGCYDIGSNTFLVGVSDGRAGSDEAAMNINVLNVYDGKLGLVDLAGFAANWLRTACLDSPPCGGADLTGDFSVLPDDLLIFADNWLAGTLPVAYLKFDETSGLLAHDSSMTGCNGVLKNFPADDSQWVPGQKNNALSFDGANDYVQVTGFKGIAGAGPRTCAAWIKPQNTGKTGMFASWGAPANGQKWYFRVNPTGELSVGVWGGYVAGTKNLADGQWHHVAAVIENAVSPTVADIMLYVDGVRDSISSSTGLTQTINTSAAEDVFVGVSNNNGTLEAFFTGLLDDLRLYNYALTEQEITGLAK